MRGRLGILAAYAAARRRRFRNRQELERWQRRRLRHTLARAQRVFGFYTSLSSTDINDYPIVDKSIIISQFERFNDRGLTLKRCVEAARQAEASRDFTATLAGVSIGLSSGTSGQQSVFLTSAWERRQWAGTMLAKALPGLRAKARVALILRAGGPLYESVGGGRISFHYIDLARPQHEQYTDLAKFQPTILAAPPQALVLLAQALREGSLSIAPDRIFSIAEVLDPHDQDYIESAFNIRVDQIYQATEGFLGISCERGRLHLNEDTLIIEREDIGQGRFIPLVTDLYRRTQAVIRLRLDDVLVESTHPCDCGSPLQTIERVEGRHDDVLLLPTATDTHTATAKATDTHTATATAKATDTATLQPLFADFVRGCVLAVPGVEDFRVLQQTPQSLHVAVRPDHLYPPTAEALRAFILRSGYIPPHIEQMDFPTDSPAVKRRRVRRDWVRPRS